jgi:hypothetical protein
VNIVVSFSLNRQASPTQPRCKAALYTDELI